MSCECPLASGMSKGALCEPKHHGDGAQMGLGDVGTEQGAIGAQMPGPCALPTRLCCTSPQ